jgi:hypothetical protein
LLFTEKWSKRMVESEWIATARPLHVLLGLVLRLRAVLGLCVAFWGWPATTHSHTLCVGGCSTFLFWASNNIP